ncbi:DNA-binding protein [Paenibacillus terrae]|uniref:DNA-binding protein n=1 Tax=Paenibacillus terrae TaxID=159743 RepID=UPI0016568C15|nr:DNA-binding protein [Paenibacillus terrae]
MMDDLDKLPLVFEIAEEIYAGGNPQGAVPYYECVAENERHQHDENLAISQYRLFRTALGKDLEKNRDAAIRFANFRNRLPLNYQLDAYYKLAGLSFNLHKWGEVESYADELQTLVKIVYRDELGKLKSKKNSHPLVTDHPFVFYYGYSYLAKSTALQKNGQYEEAKQYISGYADLSWIEILDEQGMEVIEKFKLWPKGNGYTLDILQGHTENLSDYTHFLEENPNEILSGLVTVESANKYGFLIDHILGQFKDEIDQFDNCIETVDINRHLRFRYQLAKYQFHQGRRINGFENTLHSTMLSVSINSHQMKYLLELLFWNMSSAKKLR